MNKTSQDMIHALYGLAVLTEHPAVHFLFPCPLLTQHRLSVRLYVGLFVGLLRFYPSILFHSFVSTIAHRSVSVRPSQEIKVLYPLMRPELYRTTLFKQAKGVLL